MARIVAATAEAVEDIRSAVLMIVAPGVTSTTAVPKLRVRPSLPIPRKKRLYCLANRSRNIAGGQCRKLRQLLQLRSQNASNLRLSRMSHSRAFPASRLL